MCSHARPFRSDPVLRLSGLLHVAKHLRADSSVEISAETMTDAIRIVEYLMPHMLAVSELMEESEDMTVAKRILEWIEAKQSSSFSRRDLFRAVCCAQIPKAKNLDGGLSLLVERNWLQDTTPPRHPGAVGRSPSPTFAVHRSLLRPDELDSAEDEAA